MIINALSTTNNLDTCKKLLDNIRPTLQKFTMCPVFKGRLGNEMFIFASSYGIALLKGMKIEVQERSLLFDTFNLSVGIQNGRYSDCRSSSLRIIRESKPAEFKRELMTFNPNTSVSLQDYLQSYHYFSNYTKEIKRQYVFRKNIQDKADMIFKSICEKHGIKDRKTKTLIGVHVRRGDMVKDRQSGYNVAPRDYLYRAVKYFKDKYKNTIFLVITNGMKWTKQNMPKDVTIEYIGSYSPAVELATATKCDHFITTIGSFSWWAGWLTGGEVVYYKWPAKDGSKYRSLFSSDYSDYFPPTWIGIS